MNWQTCREKERRLRRKAGWTWVSINLRFEGWWHCCCMGFANWDDIADALPPYPFSHANSPLIGLSHPDRHLLPFSWTKPAKPGAARDTVDCPLSSRRFRRFSEDVSAPRRQRSASFSAYSHLYEGDILSLPQTGSCTDQECVEIHRQETYQRSLCAAAGQFNTDHDKAPRRRFCLLNFSSLTPCTFLGNSRKYQTPDSGSEKLSCRPPAGNAPIDGLEAACNAPAVKLTALPLSLGRVRDHVLIVEFSSTALSPVS